MRCHAIQSRGNAVCKNQFFNTGRGKKRNALIYFMLKNKSYIFRIAAYSMLTLFVLLFVFWLALFNRNHVLYLQEQTQLFRFGWFYFNTYWIKPGGVTDYLGAFLTQFNFYPWIGAIILSLLMAGVYLLLDFICRHNGKTGYLFVFLFIPVLLLMIVLIVTKQCIPSYLLGFIFGLVGFRVYIALKRPVRYVGGFVIFLAVYILAAGNAIIFTILAFIFELFSKKHPLNYLYLIALTIWTMLIPFLAFRFVYTVTLREAFFALTPVAFPSPDLIAASVWLFFPILYAIWRWLSAKVNTVQPSVWKLISSCIPVIGMSIGSMFLVNDSRAEMFTDMAFSVQNGRWEKVIQLGASYPFSNNLISYFTNIALAESGMLPYRMFFYDQTGTNGLFLERQSSSMNSYISEAYYRLGLMQEAERNAYEVMVGNTKEHNSQELRRLVTISLITRDTALFNKYIRLFDHTLFYREWAGQQRQQMALALDNPAYTLPGIPQAALCDDFFLNSNISPDFVLNNLLVKNPDHRLAFEYLMAWYMLNKDLDNLKNCMDNYFYRFQYPNIPVHYEEALLLYRNINPTEQILEQYPISELTRERFNNYKQAYKLVQSNQQLTMLYQQFGNTYWFYHFFKQPASLRNTEDETDRY